MQTCFVAEKGDALKRIRKSLDLTQAEMADALGTSRGTYKNWEIREPTVEAWKAALALVKSPTMVMEAMSPYSAIKNIGVGAMIELPQYGSAHAGDGESETYDNTVYVPAQFGYDDYGAYVVEGTSMADILFPGDVVIFRHQKNPKVNDINLIKTDGNVCLKWVTFENGVYVCKAHNPQYKQEETQFSDGTFSMGYLVGYYRDDGETMEIKHRRSGNLFSRPIVP